MEEYLFALILLLLIGRALGLLFQRLGTQSIVGEVLAGIMLGPLALALTSGSWGIMDSVPLKVFAELGIIMLMLLAGLLTDFRAFSENKGASIVVGALGVLVTFAFIFFPLYLLVKLSLIAALFIAAILSNTAIEICARLLIDSPRTRLSTVVIGASFVDDIIAVFLLGVVSSLARRGEILYSQSYEILKIAVMVALFIVISLLIATKFFNIVFDLLRKEHEKITLTATIVVAFIFALIAKGIGLHEVIGAYIAGLIIGKWGSTPDPMLKRRLARSQLLRDIDTPLRGIFGPIFFGYIGVIFILPPSTMVTHIVPLVILVTVLAIGGKIIGCGLGAKMYKFERGETFVIGCAMCGRGALELVLLSYGREIGVIDDALFSALVVVTMLTVLITPVLYSASEKLAR